MNRQGCNGTFGGILFGLVFFSCGLLFLLVFGQSYTLRCDRPEPSQIVCTRERRWFRVVPTGGEPVQGLSQAWVGESCDEDGCTYRVELATAEGEMGFTGYYSSGYDEKMVTASQINTFLTDSRIEALEVRSDAGLFGFAMPALFMLIGLGIALASAVRVLRLLLGGSALLLRTKGRRRNFEGEQDPRTM